MDEGRFERLLGTLLRIGVSVSAVVVLAGGTIYLIRHADERPEYGEFQPDRLPHLRSPRGIVESALGIGDRVSGRGIIQLGLLLLIATPVVRVVFSVGGFARQGDGTYVVLTLLVLGVLLYSLFFEGP
jgi:uncharacterized membrane protein